MDFLYDLLFGVLAFMYAAVGHGGGSGYLAAMGIMGVEDPSVMRSTALFLNLFVSLTAFLFYRRYRYFDPKLFLYLTAGSLPMAFLGGTIKMTPSGYYIIVAVFLIYSSFRLLGLSGRWADDIRPFKPTKALLAGALIGLVSGVIGIGGGILLSPMILVLRWARAKTTAGISALFIFVNSSSGLVGLYSTNQFGLHPEAFKWVAIVLAFGMLGAWMGSSVMSQKAVRYLLVSVLLLASIKLIMAI
jgi:uncharacterized membrane protein YfcA